MEKKKLKLFNKIAKKYDKDAYVVWKRKLKRGQASCIRVNGKFEIRLQKYPLKRHISTIEKMGEANKSTTKTAWFVFQLISLLHEVGHICLGHFEDQEIQAFEWSKKRFNKEIKESSKGIEEVIGAKLTKLNVKLPE